MMTTSGEPADFAPSDCSPSLFLKAIRSPVVSRAARAGRSRDAPRAERARVPFDEKLRGVVTAQAQEVNAHGRLDERGEVSSGAHGQDEVRDCDFEYVEGARVESQTVYLLRLVPAFEPDAQAYLLRPAHGRDAEQLAYVQNAEAANLHVLAQHVGRRADEVAGARGADDDDVVADEPVAARDEVERALGLADARVAFDQHAEAVQVQKYAVARLARRERVFEVFGHFRDGRGTDERRLHERERRGLCRLRKLGGRHQPLRHEHARNLVEFQTRDGLAPLARSQLAEVLQLALAGDLHAPLVY